MGVFGNEGASRFGKGKDWQSNISVVFAKLSFRRFFRIRWRIGGERMSEDAESQGSDSRV